MKPVISEEIYAFLGMTVLGVAIGVLFDIFRSFRKIIVKKEFFVHISDILFWGVSLGLAMKAIYVFNDGMLRMCFFAASFFGGLLYFLTLSAPFRGGFSIILKINLKIFKFIFKILLTPGHFLYKILLVAFEGSAKKIKKIFKRKKGKKRGCRNDKKKQKDIDSDHRSFFGNCFFVNKRNSIAAENKRE